MRHFKGEVGTQMHTFRVTKEMREKASNGKYTLTKKEKAEIREKNKHIKRGPHYKLPSDKVNSTSYKLLSHQLNTRIDSDTIQKCTEYRRLGNGTLRIKYLGNDGCQLIKVSDGKGSAGIFRIIE